MANAASTAPTTCAPATPVAPWPKTTVATGLPKTNIATLAGTRAAAASRVPVDRSARTSSSRPATACRLIRGSSAVITETATTACGSWKRV